MSSLPEFSGIDHIHLYVSDRSAAEAWYRDTLGFHRVQSLLPWATDNGPLTIEDAGGKVHLALFERDPVTVSTGIALGTDGQGFLGWKRHLETRGLELRLADHTLAYSMYFHDPDQNMHEITTYERDYVATRLA